VVARGFTYSGKRTKTQQRRLLNACVSKLILLSANQYHNNGPLTNADGKKIQQMLIHLGSMELKYQ